MADSGKGIAAEEIPLLCKKFGKLYRTAEMNTDGIGLGLMISKALIEANGGKLKIASKGIDRGSVFDFTMSMISYSNLIVEDGDRHVMIDTSIIENTMDVAIDSERKSLLESPAIQVI